MNRSIAVLTGLAAVGLAVASFVVLGMSRLVVGYETAVLLAAPLGTLAFALAVALFAGFTFALIGVGPLADGEEQ